MSDNLKVLFGFLGGTIVAVEGGYKVLQDHSPDKIYQRLSDAKWFLALLARFLIADTFLSRCLIL